MSLFWLGVLLPSIPTRSSALVCAGAPVDVFHNTVTSCAANISVLVTVFYSEAGIRLHRLEPIDPEASPARAVELGTRRLVASRISGNWDERCGMIISTRGALRKYIPWLSILAWDMTGRGVVTTESLLVQLGADQVESASDRKDRPREMTIV